MLLTIHGVVCLRSVGKLTISIVLLGQTCPCGCLQSKQLPWKEYSQSDNYLTVVSVDCNPSDCPTVAGVTVVRLTVVCPTV